MRTVGSLAVFCLILHISHFALADVPDLLPNAIGDAITNIIPNCVFGVDSVSFVVFSRSQPYGKAVPQSETVCPNSTRAAVVIHGFVSEANTTNFFFLAETWLNKEDITIYALDWSDAACQGGLSLTDLLAYGSAVNNVPDVGHYVSNYTERLISECRVSTYIPLIGHSLGSHVAGFAAKYLMKNTGRKPQVIMGLDPAGVLYSNKPCDERLCSSDAENVIIFHTTITLGMSFPVGKYDYFFNGGYLQPGCVLPDCSHSKAITYFTCSLLPNCTFVGIQWERGQFMDKTILDCDTVSCNIAGLQAANTSATGSFYVKTKDQYPYCYDISKLQDSLDQLEDGS